MRKGKGGKGGVKIRNILEYCTGIHFHSPLSTGHQLVRSFSICLNRVCVAYPPKERVVGSI